MRKMPLKCIQEVIKENQLLLKDLLVKLTKIYKYMTSIPKNVFIDKLDRIQQVNKYNNIHQRTIKLNPLDAKNNTYKESNIKDPKFKVGDHVRISKYKIIFAKGCY